MRQRKVLILDDEPDIRELLALTLDRMGLDSRSAANLKEAFAWLAREPFDLCLADLCLPDGEGIELVRRAAINHPDTPVAVITAHGSMDTAIEAMKAGAFDFVSKPVDLPVLRELVSTALRLRKEPLGVDERSEETADGPQLLGNSPVMEKVRTLINKLARSQAPVFITGESGTGKELAARMIHARGPRANRPFVAVNCGAIPHELMESELFGHIRGSFTGANKDSKGLFQAAEGGTLFLDEVADLPLSLQVKLLRAIQEKAVRPIGAQAEQRVDVRIVSATHKDLVALVHNGELRQDLFYRINVIDLRMPPLRERRDDIPLLVDHILSRIARESGVTKPRLSRDASTYLSQWNYPGNVRELENVLERASTLCEANVIQVDDLGIKPSAGPRGPTPVAQNLEAQLAEVEKAAIVEALDATRWNRTAAAKRLGISFRALRYRLEKLGLDLEH